MLEDAPRSRLSTYHRTRGGTFAAPVHAKNCYQWYIFLSLILSSTGIHVNISQINPEQRKLNPVSSPSPLHSRPNSRSALPHRFKSDLHPKSLSALPSELSSVPNNLSALRVFFLKTFHAPEQYFTLAVPAGDHSTRIPNTFLHAREFFSRFTKLGVVARLLPEK